MNAARFCLEIARRYTATKGNRNQPSYRVRVPSIAAMPAPANAPHPCVSRNLSVKYSSAKKQAKKTDSVMAVDCRYITLGLAAKRTTAVIAAAVEPKIRRTAAKRKAPARTKQAPMG